MKELLDTTTTLSRQLFGSWWSTSEAGEGDGRQEPALWLGWDGWVDINTDLVNNDSK